MATTKLNKVILAAARRLKDGRVYATDAGKRFSSAVLTGYANDAVRQFVLDMYNTLGEEERFEEMFPELVKTSGVLVLAGGAVAMPSDALYMTDLSTENYAVRFTKLSQDLVDMVRAGRDKLIVPIASKPVFWQEGNSIKTLGVTSGNVIGRYIIMPTDVSPIVGVAGAGNKNTATGSYVAATRTLTVTMTSALSAVNDVNKIVVLYSTGTTSVYVGRISSVTTVGPANAVMVLDGDGLPQVNLTANVSVVLIVDYEAFQSDIVLKEIWLPQIVDRMVALGGKDVA